MADMLSSLLSLEELALTDMSVGNMDYEKLFSAIKLLNHLRKLNLGGIRFIDDRAVADMLSSLFSMEELVLTDMSAGIMDNKKLFSAIKLLNHLRKLELGGVKLRDPKVLFDMLPSLSILEEIVFPVVDLTNTDCMTGYFAALESLRYLKNLDLGRIKPASEALACVLPSLQLLEKASVGLDSERLDHAITQLFGALGKLKYLKELHLREFWQRNWCRNFS